MAEQMRYLWLIGWRNAIDGESGAGAHPRPRRSQCRLFAYERRVLPWAECANSGYLARTRSVAFCMQLAQYVS